MQHNMIINYIPFSKLNVLYPMEEKYFSKGSFGKIYKSNNKFAIKVFDPDPMLVQLSLELNIHASLCHPCILRPLAWSVHNCTGYLVMELGENIIQAYKENKIRYTQIITNTLSAISYMNSIGFAHSDIKPDNMIYLRGKCMIIDMGLSQKGVLNEDGDYYITGDLYTSNYRDPEYYKKQNNSIKCEAYSLASSYKEIVESKPAVYGDIYSYNSHLTLLNDFVSLVKKPVTERLSINRMMESLKLDKRQGTMFYEDRITNNSSNWNLLREALDWIVKRCYKENTKVETMFLCLHITRYCFNKMIKSNVYKSYFPLKTFTSAVLTLVFNIKREKKIAISYWFNKQNAINNILEFEEHFNDMIVKIIIAIDGVVDRITTWNYAKGESDLRSMLTDFYDPHYQIGFIRKVDGITNKSVHVRNIVFATEYDNYSKNYYEEDVELFLSEIYPSKLDLSHSTTEIVSCWHSVSVSEYIFYYVAGVLLHNRGVLSNLKKCLALDIFAYLIKCKEFYDIANYILVTECHPNWHMLTKKIIKNNLHPFRMQMEPITLEDISSELEIEDHLLSIKLNTSSMKDQDFKNRKTSSPSPVSKSPQPMVETKSNFLCIPDDTYYHSTVDDEFSSFSLHLPLDKSNQKKTSFLSWGIGLITGKS